MPRSRFEVSLDKQGKGNGVRAVRFSNGVLNEEERERVDFKCFSSSKMTPGVSKRSIVKAEIKGITYIGKNFGDANRFPTDSCSYSIAVHYKKKGKVRVMPVDLFQLEPWFEDKTSQKVETNSSFRDKVDVLTKEFGSGKKQKAVNQRLRNKMDEKMINVSTKSVIDSAHTKKQADGLSNAALSGSTSIPPHNKDATSPDGVYKLEDLISGDALESLKNPSGIFSSSTSEDRTSWRQAQSYPSFILAKLDFLASHDDVRTLQCQLLQYVHYLFKVAQFKYTDWRKKFPLPKEWPQTVQDHIYGLFTTEIKEPGKPPQRKCTQQNKDLLLSHILILCLKLSDFSLDLSLIASDLKLPISRLRLHSTSIGCHVKKSKINPNSIVAELSIPPNFVELRPKAVKNRIF